MRCEKKDFETSADAYVFASRMLRSPDCDTRVFRAYRCPNCHKYHLTTKKKYDFTNRRAH